MHSHVLMDVKLFTMNWEDWQHAKMLWARGALVQLFSSHLLAPRGALLRWDLTMLNEVNIIDSYVNSTRFHFFEYRSSRTCYVFYVGIDFLIILY